MSLSQQEQKIINRIEALEVKFETLRKAVIEQHNRIDPVYNELLDNRQEFMEMRRREEGIEMINEGTLQAAKSFLEKKNKTIWQRIKALFGRGSGN